MFDINKVGNNIKEARTKMNMTQMNLADEMGVSYQAVSNWERGNSMPDISKLPELCKILNLSFEELVGEKNEETDITERLMLTDDGDVTLEEMAQVAPLLKPDKIEEKVEETMKKEGSVSFSTLVGLAPFMDKETLGRIAEEIADVDTKKLSALAPFLSKEALDHIIEKRITNGTVDTNHIVEIVPFLSRTTVEKIAGYFIEHGQDKKLIEIAPFMHKSSFFHHVKDIIFDTGKERENAGEPADTELEDLEEDEVAKLAAKALEQGDEVDRYLDYMDDDDIAELAAKALEKGKSIESFLDYMDDDTVKKLLLQVTGKH